MLSKGGKHIVAALSVHQSVPYLVRQITADPMSYGPWDNSKFKIFHLVCSITQIIFIVRGYNILPKFVNQLIASSIQVIQIDSRHLLSYYMPISLVYYYTGVFCDMDNLVHNCCLSGPYLGKYKRDWNGTWLIDRCQSVRGSALHKNHNPTLYIYIVISP